MSEWKSLVPPWLESLWERQYTIHILRDRDLQHAYQLETVAWIRWPGICGNRPQLPTATRHKNNPWPEANHWRRRCKLACRLGLLLVLVVGMVQQWEVDRCCRTTDKGLWRRCAEEFEDRIDSNQDCSRECTQRQPGMTVLFE